MSILTRWSKDVLAGLLLSLLLFGVAPFALAGHEQGERPVGIHMACDNPASPVGIIEASKTGTSTEFFEASVLQGRCKQFNPTQLFFWFDAVVIDDLIWEDGELMYVIQGHDKNGFVVFTWTPAAVAHKWGWTPGPTPTPTPTP